MGDDGNDDGQRGGEIKPLSEAIEKARRAIEKAHRDAVASGGGDDAERQAEADHERAFAQAAMRTGIEAVAMRRALAIARLTAGQQRIIDWEPQEGALLYVLGEIGSGKTTAAVRLAVRLLRAGASPPVFVNMPEYLDGLRSRYDGVAGGAWLEIETSIKRAPLVILDDLGAERSSSWVAEKLYVLVNRRDMAGLPLVVTSNVPLSKIEGKVGERVGSRLHGMSRVPGGGVITLETIGDDRRRSP